MNYITVDMKEQANLDMLSGILRKYKVYNAATVVLEYNKSIHIGQDIVFNAIKFSTAALNEITFDDFSRWILTAVELEMFVICESMTSMLLENIDWVTDYIGDVIVLSSDKPWNRNVDFTNLSSFDMDIVSGLYTRRIPEFNLNDKIRMLTIKDDGIYKGKKQIGVYNYVHPLTWLSYMDSEIVDISEYLMRKEESTGTVNTSVYSLRDLLIYEYQDQEKILEYKYTFLSKFINLNESELASLDISLFNLCMKYGYVRMEDIKEVLTIASNWRNII